METRVTGAAVDHDDVWHILFDMAEAICPGASIPKMDPKHIGLTKGTREVGATGAAMIHDDDWCMFPSRRD